MAKIKQYTIEITPITIEMYNNGCTPKYIAKELSTSECTIRAILKRNKIVIRGHLDAHRKYSLNEDVFKNKIFKEYWCGLMLSDGNVFKDNRRNNSYCIRLELNEIDKHIIEEYKEFLEYDGPIRCSKNQCCIRISSQELYFDLQKLGINEEKTYNTTIIDDFKNNPLFWRGYLDGDGSIWFQDNHIRLSLGSACRSVIEEFYLFAKQIVPDSKASIDDTYTQNLNSFYRIIFGGEYALRILDKIYSCEGPKLIRKYNKYMKGKQNALALSR